MAYHFLDKSLRPESRLLTGSASADFLMMVLPPINDLSFTDELLAGESRQLRGDAHASVLMTIPPPVNDSSFLR